MREANFRAQARSAHASELALMKLEHSGRDPHATPLAEARMRCGCCAASPPHAPEEAAAGYMA
eukprot:7391683-Prymnesium_polylepis.2